MGFIISIILAYLIGSLSFAIIIAKLMRLPDPRSTGSKNPGATNMLRLGGTKAAVAVLLADGAKGLVAVIIGRLFHVHGVSLAFVALVATLGHVFPLYFKFKGGKGVATMMGSLLGLSFWVGLFAIATWFLVAFLTRYSSLAALVSSVAAPIYFMVGSHADYLFPVILMTLLIIWKHWENIQRLRKGTEEKIKF